jgi:hypothetical protein
VTILKKTKMESYGSEYCMSAGDNSLRRDQIDDSIKSKATANEHSFRQAAMAGLNGIAGQGKTVDNTPPPPLPPVDDDTRMATHIPQKRPIKAHLPPREHRTHISEQDRY